MRHATWLLILCSPVLLLAQQSKAFKTRLAPVPIDMAMQATIAGSGTVSATLTGTKLAVTGTFEGLRSPATTAQLHRSPVRGARGPAIFDLAVTKSDGTSGTLSGTVELSAVQVADLEKGRLYVQLHSEKAPDGNLWGWLTAIEGKR
jgi:hypothetical protein